MRPSAASSTAAAGTAAGDSAPLPATPFPRDDGETLAQLNVGPNPSSHVIAGNKVALAVIYRKDGDKHILAMRSKVGDSPPSTVLEIERDPESQDSFDTDSVPLSASNRLRLWSERKRRMASSSCAPSRSPT